MKVISIDVAKEYVMGNYPNDPLLRAMATTLLESLPSIDIDPETKVAEKNPWIPVEERTPTEDEWEKSEHCSFLCRVVAPAMGGVAREEFRVISWHPAQGWICGDVIVEAWMPIPPKENE